MEKSGDKEIVEKVNFSLLSDVNAKALQVSYNVASPSPMTKYIVPVSISSSHRYTVRLFAKSATAERGEGSARIPRQHGLML